MFTKIKNKLLKTLRDTFGNQKAIDTLEKQINTQLFRKLNLYESDLGKYYLPSSITSDVIINHMKQGQVFEPEVVEVARKYIHEGSTVLDVGANFGQMTMIFSKFVGEKGKVLSFEADDFVHSVLAKNVLANNCKNVQIIFGAVYDKDGNIMLYPVQDFTRFGSYGSYGLDPNAKQGRKVQTLTIDSLNIETPISFMKVDVQGSDLFVLKGAIETIKKHQMPIIFEYEEQFQEEFNTCWQDYLNFIELIDYKIEQVVYGINYLITPKNSG